ncbi:unnamed protein product [Closterium sp. NIES-65]|nr:unnamed protein product [Closterium sp. NIES-65]
MIHPHLPLTLSCRIPASPHFRLLPLISACFPSFPPASPHFRLLPLISACFPSFPPLLLLILPCQGSASPQFPPCFPSLPPLLPLISHPDSPHPSPSASPASPQFPCSFSPLFSLPSLPSSLSPLFPTPPHPSLPSPNLLASLSPSSCHLLSLLPFFPSLSFPPPPLPISPLPSPPCNRRDDLRLVVPEKGSTRAGLVDHCPLLQSYLLTRRGIIFSSIHGVFSAEPSRSKPRRPHRHSAPCHSCKQKVFPAVKGRAACEYVNYKAMGLSLCVEDGKVAAVHVYSDVHGYKAFAGTLPFGLKVIMYAMERSEYESQGGGGSADMKAMVESSGGHSNPHTRTSSRTFPLLLPPLSHPPRVSMKAKEVVAALGEPDVKAGGGQQWGGDGDILATEAGVAARYWAAGHVCGAQLGRC